MPPNWLPARSKPDFRRRAASSRPRRWGTEMTTGCDMCAETPIRAGYMDVTPECQRPALIDETKLGKLGSNITQRTLMPFR